MADTNKNVGGQVTVSVYLENKKLARDFGDSLQLEYKHVFYSGDDEYLGPNDVRPWRRYKKTTGSLSINEFNATFVELVIDQIISATLLGLQPKIVLSKITTNSDGTTSKIVFKNVVFDPEYAAPGKGEKNKYTFPWEGTRTPPE